MRLTLPCRLLTLGATSLLLSAPAWAGATVYTTQASFFSAIQPAPYTQTFDGAADAALSFSYAGNGFGYTVTAAPLQGFNDDVYLSGSFIGNYYDHASLTVTFTAGNPTAVGGNFYLTDINNLFFPSTPVTITLSDGTVSAFTPASASDYRGFTSSVPITSLTMATTLAGRFNTLDNLTVGKALSVAAVPEPATGWLLLAGLVGVVALQRRRNRGAWAAEIVALAEASQGPRRGAGEAVWLAHTTSRQ